MTTWLPDLSKRNGPRYRAIAEALRSDIAEGRLGAGVRLPTHRDLAYRLGVTVGTVTRAYAEAERSGLVAGTVGRGTFVRGDQDVTAGHLAAFPYPAIEAAGFEGDVIELSRNFPASGEEGPVIAKLLAEVAAAPTFSNLLDYQPHAGMAAHRMAGSRWVARAGLHAPAERIVVTGGGQYGISMALGSIAEPGDVILTEALTYPGLTALGRLLKLRVIGVPIDEDGLRPDALEAALRFGRVKALYLVPTLHNPTTRIMSEARRRQIAAIASAHDIVVIEDDAYGFLVSDAPPAIANFAPDQTIHLTSTSKSLAPGLRIGHALVPERLIGGMLATMRATSWMASPVMAEVVSRAIMDGTAERLAQAKRREAAARQEMAHRLLQGVHLETKPTSFHIWLSLPEPWRSQEFAEAARRQGVAISPADAFATTDRSGGRVAVPAAVRISVGGVKSRELLAKGLNILARLAAQRPAPARIVDPYLSIV
ncbi:MAG: PLP-dependent aminotransferase family protein [Alphaproteobacteria bacterium]|nr:PLP-dependent aminotransferase family protein [Alphaproteobacteria bacterium]